MKIFLDTANIPDIRDRLEIIDGITTNPSLVARESNDLFGHVRKIADLAGNRIVMAEVLARDSGNMAAEGRRLHALGPKMMIKVPATPAGLSAASVLSHEGIAVTVTLVFTALQALLAARAGASAAALFVGRLDDAGQDGASILHAAFTAIQLHKFSMSIVAASLRSVERAEACLAAGASMLTLPPPVADRLLDHPLTASGLAKFLSDWQQIRPSEPAVSRA